VKRCLISALVIGVCTVSLRAHAAATEWEAHSTQVLDAIRSRIHTHPGLDQVQVLAEFPTQDTPGHFLESTSTFLLPTNVSAQYDITELNNAGAYCGQFQDLTQLANDASVAITKVWSLGLDIAVQLERAVLESELVQR
jgi:hypothetical protein